MGLLRFYTSLALISASAFLVRGQSDDLGLANGYTNLKTDHFDLRLVTDAQILASLRPSGSSFDFLPSDYLPYRAANGQYHIGDITFRYRAVGDTEWTAGDSSQARAVVKSLDADALAAADLTSTLPGSSALQVVRQWLDVDGDLGLSFTLTNKGNSSVEIGSLGFPIESNSIFTNRTADEVTAQCSLVDPYIGLDAGYLQFTPTSGQGPALIITPLVNTSTPFEAWRNLAEVSDQYTGYGSQTFEGFYEWQIHSKAYAEKEWAEVNPWNEPTARSLKPGESTTVGLRFSVVKDGVRGIQKAVRGTNTPLTIGTGYVVPRDLTAQLFIFHSANVSKIVSDNDAFDFARPSSNLVSLSPTESAWGRTKVTISYADGKVQTVHYFITDTAPDVISKLGDFSTTAMWFDDEKDPFGRAPSVITYDEATKAQVLQEARVWIAGLMDEGGAIFLASTMKEHGLPNAAEVAKLEEFASKVLFGTIQNTDFTVRKSVFYYDPEQLPNYEYSSNIDWGNWWSWNKDASYSTDRAYDYIHVIGAYWSLYRVGRDNPTLLKVHSWQWYLGQAYNTTVTCFATNSAGDGLVGYSRLGLMGETVVGELLADLQREGWTQEADAVEAAMKLRAEAWDSQSEPFGSEMAWDCTGQEGVYYWSNYAGKLQRIERMIHHYGSSLNALPLLAEFRQNPTDTHLLRVGYGGITGPLSNIREDGSMYNAFHSFPDTLKGDDYSGDYGPNFLGMMLGAGTYIVDDPDVGIIAYGGNLSVESDTVTVQPRDAVRRRVYVASMGVYVTINAGQIEEFSFSVTRPNSLELKLIGGTSNATTAIVWVENPGTNDAYAVTASGDQTRGGVAVDLSGGSATVTVARQ
ncbi:hypothetical protein ABOM_008706 [Aspergillus bombycis]|uniref:Uncharacterized protein n=1 Tax=Aspergillus bombycis TaxID=109264 RepID=A0A1F7ZVP0_9EURO|nr:hypothetical protein ABOM_008706 [Aspergillus bombycis]OGM43319.1 hypothetical protein ABOM_008706 [Aspergillus bombycis]